MKTFIDAIDFYTYEVNNWKEVKPFVTGLLDQSTYTRVDLDGMAEFESDRSSKREYVPEMMNLLTPIYQKFANDIDAKTINIDDMWSVRYQKGDHHTVHTHGSCNWSAAFYVDFDPKVHKGTHFVTKIVDANTNSSIIKSPAADEGIIIFFPSNLLHFTLPNKSDKIRRVISLDCTTTKRINV